MTRSPCLALALLVAACSSITTPPEPAAFRVLQRPDTLVVPGAVFDTVAIQVVDAAGAPVTGVLVEWSGDGEVIPLNTRTDDVGVARATWTLPGRVVQEYTRPPARTGPSGRFAAAATVPGLGTVTVHVTARPFTVDTVDASHHYGCGLRGDELWCWGAQYPLSPTPGRQTRRVTLPATLVPTAVIAGEEMLCVLDQASRPHCAIREHGDRFDPIGAAPGVRDVQVRGAEMCGISIADGSIWCWNASHGAFHGQMATRVQDGPFVALAKGRNAVCGLTSDGIAKCWGGNDRGQLGDGTTTNRANAEPVSGGHEFIRIEAGDDKFCGSESDGTLWCWGQMGIGEQSDVPVRIDAAAVRGPDFRVGLIGELYVFPNRQVRVHGEAGDVVTTWFSGHTIKQFSLDHSACLLNLHNEVYCSWDVLHGMITHAWAPLEPIPVPPPPNGW